MALGGLALFLYGLNLAALALQTLAGPGLNRLLRASSRAPLIGVLVGALVTGVAQSATAVGLMTIHFSRAGMIGVRDGIAVLLGSAIGGTLAVQLVSLQIFGAAWPLIASGFALSLVGRTQALGRAVIGTGMGFLGLQTLLQALRPIHDAGLTHDLLVALSSSPIALALLGALLTFALHSSNAPAIIAMGLLGSGVFTPEGAVALMIGANIGTPVNVYLLALGQGVDAKRFTAAHLLLKIIAAMLALGVLPTLTSALAGIGNDPSRFVANAHTLYNVAVAVLALPLLALLERVMRRAIPDPPERGVRPQYLDQNALGTPQLAYSLAFREVTRVADHVLEMTGHAFSVLEKSAPNAQAVAQVKREEETVDLLVHNVVIYLAQLPNEPRVHALLAICTNLEAMGDLLKRWLRQLEKLEVRGLQLSPAGAAELGRIAALTLERTRLTLTAFSIGDASGCRFEDSDVQHAMHASRAAHLARLRNGADDSALTSSVHLDMLTVIEQLNAEISGVARAAPLLVWQNLTNP